MSDIFHPSRAEESRLVVIDKDGNKYKPRGDGLVSPDALVSREAVIGSGCRVGPGVVIEGLVILEQGTKITGNSHIGSSHLSKGIRIVASEIHNQNLEQDGLLIKNNNKILPLD